MAIEGPIVQQINNGAVPVTRDDLSAKVKEYQNSKDCDGMIGLFYAQGTEDDRRKVFQQTIKDNICANFSRRIASVAFQPLNPDKVKQPQNFEGRPSAYTLTPAGSMVIDYGYGKPGDTKSLTFLYGSIDNRTYLITTKNAEAK